MNKPMRVLQPNETTKLLDQLNTIYYFCGLRGYWITEVKNPKRFTKFFDIVEYIMFFLSIYFPVSIVASKFTQHDLTEKQTSDQLMFSIIFFGSMVIGLCLLHHKADVKEIFYHLAVILRDHHNDPKLEQEMIKKIKIFSFSLSALAGSLATSYGLNALYHGITLDENFNTIIPAWPDVHDKSAVAGVMRFLFFLLWYIVGSNIMSTFSILVSLLIAICYQFKNLQSYFYSLDDIFSNESLSQAEKEMKYEQAFNLGIHMHALTLWCKRKHQHVCKEVFAVKVVLFFSMLLSQLMTLLGSNDRSLAKLYAMLLISSTTLLSLGFFMWNGGDITVEASKLSEAMYSSGWQNCYGQSSARVRKLVVNAMRQAQEPVVYKALGVVDLSYESYVNLVKMPYSLVSVFY